LTSYPISSGALYAGTVLALCAILALGAALGLTPRRCLRWVRTHWRLTALYTVAALVAVHLIFLAPPVKPGHPCATVVDLSDTLSYGVSCDSDEFIRVARHPGAISVEDSFRQGRPLQSLVAALGAFVEDPHPDRHGSTTLDSAGCTQCLQSAIGNPYDYENQPGWLPYVLLNFVQLLAAVLIFDRLLRRRGTGVNLPVLLLAVLLLANVVSKNFFWSAHTQIWNVLLPVICVAACAALVREPERDWRYMGAVGLLVGFGTLAYGSVIVIVPALIIAAALGRRLGGAALFSRESVKPTAALTAGAVAPLLAWVALIVWITDALKDGGVGRLIDEAAAMLGDFWSVLWPVMWPPLLLLAVMLVIARAAGVSVREIAESRRELLLAIGATLVVCLPFFALQGFYRERLAFNLAVPVIVAVGVVALELTARARRPYVVVVNLALAYAALGYLLAYTLQPAEYV